MSREPEQRGIVPAWLRRVTRRRRRIQGATLIEALHGVAAAAASGVDLDDALAAIVEQAKRVTDTEKAVFCLVGRDGDAPRVDPDTVVARGSREQHPETWWLARLEAMADEVRVAGHVVVAYDGVQGAWIAAAPAPTLGSTFGILGAINSGTRRFLPDEVNFLGILSAFAATALENARLSERTRHALLAGERERIARDMHDGLAQTLFSASLGLEVVARRLEADGADTTRVTDVQHLVTEGLAELRNYVHDLRSPRLEQLGLEAAVREYLADVTAGTGRRASLSVRGGERAIGESAAACLYKVAREAVTNAVRHADCTAVEVEVVFGPEVVELTVVDDGDGFDVDEALADATARGSLGLRSIHERVTHAGGHALIDSGTSGTRVYARLPRGAAR